MKKYNNKISASVMCSDLLNLEKDIRTLENLGVDMLHIDVMDAHFVPNLTFGPDFIKAMQAHTHLPVDCHFMVTEPDLMYSKLQMRKGDIFTVHAEVDRDYRYMADPLHASGALFGIAINPDTPVEAVERHLPYTDLVLLMTVYPGFAGSKLVEGIMEKVGQMRSFLDERGYQDIEISVDGSVSNERANYMASLGASVFVCGKASLYRKGLTLNDTVPEFRQAITL